jgi:enoyl-[acyl-carrier protein] reductase II
MFQDNKICELLNIRYPIIQGGMVWNSGAKLAAACSNSGILGVVGAGSMKPELLDLHIKKAKSLTTSPLAVNIPLLYKDSDKQIQTAIDNEINIFITSAGSPKKFTKLLKDLGKTVLHVVSNPLLAKKCQDAGVDIIIAEGFEAGGHNGRNEITTFCLIPQVKKMVEIPVVAAGGIATGSGLLAALALGADGAQMGTRFAASTEGSGHKNFKTEIIKAEFHSTKLLMKEVIPVRLLNNKFSKEIEEIEKNNGSSTELINYLGKGRAKKGMLEGDIDNGELEIGQISGLIDEILPVEIIVKNILKDYQYRINSIKV